MASPLLGVVGAAEGTLLNTLTSAALGGYISEGVTQDFEKAIGRRQEYDFRAMENSAVETAVVAGALHAAFRGVEKAMDWLWLEKGGVPAPKVASEPEPVRGPGRIPQGTSVDEPLGLLPGSDPLPPGSPGNRAANGPFERQGLAYELKYLDRHLPNTPDSSRVIDREGAAHVFTDMETLSRVEGAILREGQYSGTVRGWERYGMRFEEPIGHRIDGAGNTIPLHYGEMKINPQTGAYHVIPRTGASK